MPLVTAQSWLASLFSAESKAAGLTDHDLKVISDLRHEGVSVTSLDRVLGVDDGEYHVSVKKAQQLVKSEPASTSENLWTRGASSTDLTAEALLTHLPALYLLGLHVNVLRIVEAYLGVAAAYHGAVLRHSLLDNASVGTRLWHQDAEDTHVFRMILYLNDVAEGGGPFEYIPRHLGLTYKKFIGASHAITNERMAGAMPSKHWRRVLAPSGTLILADTAKVFHHESLQETAERVVVMFGFSSRNPRRRDLAESHFPVASVRRTLQALVSTGDHPYVFDWRSVALAMR